AARAAAGDQPTGRVERPDPRPAPGAAPRRARPGVAGAAAPRVRSLPGARYRCRGSKLMIAQRALRRLMSVMAHLEQPDRCDDGWAGRVTVPGSRRGSGGTARPRVAGPAPAQALPHARWLSAGPGSSARP